MATAIVVTLSDAQMRTPGNLVWSMRVIYIGTDVPGGSHVEDVSFTKTPTSAADFAASVVTAVQTQATANGYSVATGNTYLPSYVKQ